MHSIVESAQNVHTTHGERPKAIWFLPLGIYSVSLIGHGVEAASTTPETLSTKTVNRLFFIYFFYFSFDLIGRIVFTDHFLTRRTVYRWPIEFCARKSNDLNDWTKRGKCSLVLFFIFNFR